MLAYRAAGRGLPLVLLHAYPLSSAMWDKDARQLASSLAHIITPDLPGFGRSSRQTHPSIPDMALEVWQLLEALTIREPVILGGLSMGGYVAFEFVRQFPERVRGLVLASTRAGVDTPAFKRARVQSAKKIREEGLGPVPQAILPRLLGETTRASNPKVANEVSALILENESEGVADALMAMAERRDSGEILAGIQCPTLVVAGTEDSFIPMQDTRAMCDMIPSARLCEIEKAGHLVNLEQPEAFQTQLTAFIKEIQQNP